MKSFDRLRFTPEERAKVAIDLHEIANIAFKADVLDSDAPVDVEVNELTAAYLHANTDELGDDVSVHIGSTKTKDGDDFEAFHYIRINQVSPHIGRSGVAAFMRTQAELAEGKDFENLTSDLAETRQSLDIQARQREYWKQNAEIFKGQVEELSAEARRRSTLEYAEGVVAAATAVRELQRNYPEVHVTPTREEVKSLAMHMQTFADFPAKPFKLEKFIRYMQTENLKNNKENINIY